MSLKKLTRIEFLGPNWLSKKSLERQILFLFPITLHYFILHPNSTWSSWIPMKWKSSSFSCSFLHGRWRLTTEFPIFVSLCHLFCDFKNAQKQPCVLQKRSYSKCYNICRKTRVPESIFDKIKLATFFKKGSSICVFLLNFSRLLKTTFLYNTSG